MLEELLDGRLVASNQKKATDKNTTTATTFTEKHTIFALYLLSKFDWVFEVRIRNLTHGEEDLVCLVQAQICKVGAGVALIAV